MPRIAFGDKKKKKTPFTFIPRQRLEGEKYNKIPKG